MQRRQEANSDRALGIITLIAALALAALIGFCCGIGTDTLNSWIG